jgi:hypothetical protein
MKGEDIVLPSIIFDKNRTHHPLKMRDAGIIKRMGFL